MKELARLLLGECPADIETSPEELDVNVNEGRAGRVRYFNDFKHLACIPMACELDPFSGSRQHLEGFPANRLDSFAGDFDDLGFNTLLHYASHFLFGGKVILFTSILSGCLTSTLETIATDCYP